MNLHDIVRGAIPQINPDRPVTVQLSVGYTVSADGRQIPEYVTAGQGGIGPGLLALSLLFTVVGVALTAQIQPMTADDLKQVEGLSLNGEHAKIYLYGASHGITRSLQKGGDLITFGDDGSIFLVTRVLEQWPDWVAVATTRQNS